MPRELEKIDRERVRFVNEHFHKDSNDPAAYDVVLNVSHFSQGDCARLVAEFLQAIEHPQVSAQKFSKVGREDDVRTPSNGEV